MDSKKKLDTLKSIGADHVIDYTEEDFAQKGQFYDLILDVVGTRSIFDYKRVLNPKGRYVMIGGSTSRILQLLILGPMIYKTESKKMGILIHKPNKNDQNFLKELFVAGKLVPIIDRRYSLNQVEEAILHLGEGNVKGKVVVCMANNQT